VERCVHAEVTLQMTPGAAAPPATLQPQNELLIEFQSALIRLPNETTEHRVRIEQVQHGRNRRIE
jgi:hypothetical protein